MGQGILRVLSRCQVLGLGRTGHGDMDGKRKHVLVYVCVAKSCGKVVIFLQPLVQHRKGC